MTLSNAQDCISLEKLEVIGDSVLKVIVSLHLFRSFPTWDEGKMTLLRMKLISNKHLYQIGKEHDLGPILSGSFFLPDSSWLPLGFSVSENIQNFTKLHEVDYSSFEGFPETDEDDFEAKLEEIQLNGVTCKAKKMSHTTFTHSSIADKCVADSIEALIGAYFMNGSLDGAFRIMEWLGLRGPLQDGTVTPYSRDTTLTPLDSNGRPSNTKDGWRSLIPLLEDLEAILDYK